MSPIRVMPLSRRRALPAALIMAAALSLSSTALGGDRIEGGMDQKKAAGADNAGHAAVPAPGTKVAVADSADKAKTFSTADNAAVNLDRILIGDPNAPIEIIEYGSPTCGHCAQFHTDILPTLKKDYIDTGKAKLIFRPFMLNGADVYAGLLVGCVADNRRPAMLDVIYKTQQTWVPYGVAPDQVQATLTENLRKIGRQAGLSDQKFDSCMADNNTKTWLQAIMNEAQTKHKVNSTPTFVINGEVYKNMPIEDFKKALDKIHASNGPSPDVRNFAEGGQSENGRTWGQWFKSLFDA